MKSLWHQRSYEGSMKSVPDDDLLKMLAADLDPAHVKQLDQMVLWTQELQECIIMQYLLLLPFESTKRASKLSGPMLLLHSGKGTITLAGETTGKNSNCGSYKHYSAPSKILKCQFESVWFVQSANVHPNNPKHTVSTLRYFLFKCPCHLFTGHLPANGRELYLYTHATMLPQEADADEDGPTSLYQGGLLVKANRSAAATVWHVWLYFDKCPCPWISWTYKMCAGRTGCKQGCCKQFEHVVCYDNSRIFEGDLYWGTLAHFGSSFLRANRRITCFFNLGLLPEEKCVLLSRLCVLWILCLVPFHHCIFS